MTEDIPKYSMYVLLLGKASRHHCPDSTHRPLGNEVRIARAERAHGVLIGDGWSCSDSSPNIACFIGTSEREPRSPQPSRMDIPPPIGGAAAFAANGMGPLDKRWLAQVADMCDQYPQGDVYSDTVAEHMRVLPRPLGADLRHTLDESGGTVLATETIPGLCWAPQPH